MKTTDTPRPWTGNLLEMLKSTILPGLLAAACLLGARTLQAMEPETGLQPPPTIERNP